DLEAAEAFYAGVLGLKVVGREAGRHVFFQVGAASMLLVFNAASTLKGDVLPAHGATGPGHFALGIRAEGFDGWRQRLADHGVRGGGGGRRGGGWWSSRARAGTGGGWVPPGLGGLPGGWCRWRWGGLCPPLPPGVAGQGGEAEAEPGQGGGLRDGGRPAVHLQ